MDIPLKVLISLTRTGTMPLALVQFLEAIQMIFDRIIDVAKSLDEEPPDWIGPAEYGARVVQGIVDEVEGALDDGRVKDTERTTFIRCKSAEIEAIASEILSQHFPPAVQDTEDCANLTYNEVVKAIRKLREKEELWD